MALINIPKILEKTKDYHQLTALVVILIYFLCFNIIRDVGEANKIWFSSK